jgi:hypothetical protein
MQITVTIPDELAAQAQACGLTPERYVESLIVSHASSSPAPSDTQLRLRDLDLFFQEMAAESSKIPSLPDEALNRESFYQDHD